MEMQADFLHVFFAGHVMCIALFAEMHEKYQQLPNRLVHFKQSFHFAAPHDDRSTMIFSVSLSPERSQIRHKFMIHFRHQEKFGRNGWCTLCVQLERKLKSQLRRSARIVYITKQLTAINWFESSTAPVNGGPNFLQSFSRNAHQVLDLAAEGGEIKRLAALGVENPVNSKTGMAGTPL